MSIDVQFISLVDALLVSSAVEVEGASPRTIKLTARSGFADAQRVLINDYGVDSFIVASDTSILVNPPAIFDTLSVSQMNFEVASSSYTGGRSARLIFGPTKNVRKVEGLQKLVQQLVKTLLSRVNSNKFTSGEGGGLLDSLGSSLSSDAQSRITATVSQAVSQTESQVKAAQSGARGLQSSERLLSFTLTGVSFVEDRQEVRATIKLVTYAGKSIDIPLTL